VLPAWHSLGGRTSRENHFFLNRTPNFFNKNKGSTSFKPASCRKRRRVMSWKPSLASPSSVLCATRHFEPFYSSCLTKPRGTAEGKSLSVRGQGGKKAQPQGSLRSTKSGDSRCLWHSAPPTRGAVASNRSH